MTLQACSPCEKQPHENSEAGAASQSFTSSNNQHGRANVKLQQLWEDAQAAMQHSQSADCGQGGAVQQLIETSAAKSCRVLDPMSSCADPLATGKQVHTPAAIAFTLAMVAIASHILQYWHCLADAHLQECCVATGTISRFKETVRRCTASHYG